jgi:hypothetical protein
MPVPAKPAVKEMVLRFAFLVATMACARAGTIQGVVIEHVSGRPLARTVVRLDPVPKAGSALGRPLTTRAGRSGQFVFPAVEPGLYLLVAVHEGYFPGAFGQRLPTGRGTPLEVAADSAELRLRHKGALTGRVLDENGVGAVGIPVVAYRARLPLRTAGSATSDERGVYRIHGLAPGKYGPQGREVRDARVHTVTVDADAPDADLNPEPGALFHVGGLILCDTEGAVRVTLASETGRRSTQAFCPKGEYRFEGLAPAAYEVYATMTDGSASGFTEIYLDHDTEAGNVQVMKTPVAEIEVQRAGSAGAADSGVTLIGRRQDMSETEAERPIRGSRAALAPGHWEMRARVPRGEYVESIANLWRAPRRPWKAEHPADWFDVFIEPRAFGHRP